MNGAPKTSGCGMIRNNVYKMSAAYYLVLMFTESGIQRYHQ